MTKTLKFMAITAVTCLSTAAADTGNPYWPMARNAVSYTLKLSEEERATKGTGANAFWLAWTITSPEASEVSREPAQQALHSLITTIAERLESAQEPNKIPEGNFWNMQALLEALRMIENNQLYTEEERGRWKAAVRPVIEHELSNYGQKASGHWASEAAMEYPNADAQYAAVMMAAALLYDEPKYQESAKLFIDAMNNYLHPLGAWRYIRNSNPIPIYHGFELIFIGRYYQLSGDPDAADQIRRTADYYPYTFTPENTVEGASTPWWKNGWNPTGGPYHAVEFVAWLSGDGYNRWFADLRAKNIARQYWIAYCGEAWDAGFANRAEPKPFPDNFIVADKSIEGMRGRFGPFSFMGSRGMNTMSFGSAMMADATLKRGYDGYVQFARLGVAIPGREDKPYPIAIRLVADPATLPTPGAQVIGDGFAALAATYVPRLQTEPAITYEDWQVVERWLFTPQGVVACFEATALRDNPGTWPLGLVRLGPLERPHGLDGDRFHIGTLQGQVIASDKFTVTMEDRDENKKQYGVELLLKPKITSTPVASGDRYFYAVAFSPNGTTEASVDSLSGGALVIGIGDERYHMIYRDDESLQVVKREP